MHFGKKIRKLREEQGLSQLEMAKRLGYRTNSYVSDMEQGAFIPSEEKLKGIAKSLEVPFAIIKDLLLETRLEEIGIRDAGLVSLIKDYPRLGKTGQETILATYRRVKGNL